MRFSGFVANVNNARLGRPISTTWRHARRLTATLGALGLLLASAPTALSAQGSGGTVSGRVVDGATGAPIGQASVVVAGTSVGTQTGDDGRYSLLVPTVGPVTLRITRIGYEARSLPVTVRAGETTEANTNLTAASYSLSSVVVTATGQQRKIELSNATTTIAVADKLAELPVSSMGELLSGRSSGVQVLNTSEAGAGSRIRIRGQSSLSLGNNPVIIIDGVRVNGDETDGPSVGGAAPSRLNDINPEEIESIEVIKGPSAATLYGTEAAAGVINITTKRGRAGQTTWNVYTENGITNDSREGDYPLLYRLFGKRDGSAESTRCVLTQVASGNCVVDSLASGNVLNDPELTPISTGFRQQYGIQTSGGSERVQFFVSAEREMETGIYEMPELERQRLELERGPVPQEQLRPSAINRTNLRVNLTAQLSEKASLQISSGFVQSDNVRPQNGNNGNGIMVAAMGGTWQPELVDSRGIALRGYRRFPMGDVLSRTTTQDVNRFINSAALRWEPFEWLSTRATVGYDFSGIYNKEITRFDQGPQGNNRVGQIDDQRANTSQGTVDIGATITRRLNSWLGSKTSIGTQYISNRSVFTGGSGLALPPSATQITAAATRSINAGLAETRTLGTYVEQQFSINDKLFLTGAVRRDAASAFGSEARGVLYPKVGASWAISEENFMPVTDWLSSLRLRSSYGASGQIPGTTAALRFYDAFPATISPGGAEAPSVSIGALGNSNLKPEYSAEYEVGFDASLFNGRSNLEFTYYNKTTTDALISRRIAPSLAGVTSRFENIGNTNNSGIELSLGHVFVDRENFAFDIQINGSTNRNELITLGEGVSPIPSGNRSTQLNTPGFPLFGMWGVPYTFNDANGDGILEQSEMAYGDTAEFIGPTYPTREFAFTPTLELFGRKLRIQSQIDRKWGHRKLNNTLRHMCQGGSSCRGLYDASAPLSVQAASLGANSGRSIFTGFYEDGSFTRLRELSVSYTMPDRWAQAVRASRWNVILTGRNLAVWTPFSGLDPETTSFGDDDNGNEEFFSTPPLQMWTFRMNFTF